MEATKIWSYINFEIEPKLEIVFPHFLVHDERSVCVRVNYFVT